jgi:hypothetical protein
VSSTWRSADPELLPPAFEAPFALHDARVIEVVIDEGDNAPLRSCPRGFCCRRALRFIIPARRCSALRKSKSRTRATTRSSRAVFASPLRISLSTEIDERGTPMSRRKWFWIRIIIAAVVLIAMLLRLVLFSGETSRARATP